MKYDFMCSKCECKYTIVLPLSYFFNFVMPNCPLCHINDNVSRIWYAPQVIYRGNGWTLKKGEINKK